MKENAQAEKTRLTLVKRTIPISDRIMESLELDLELGSPEDLLEIESNEMELEQIHLSGPFSELLHEKLKIIQKINYFAAELEFNLD